MGEAQFTKTKLAQSCGQSLDAMSESDERLGWTARSLPLGYKRCAHITTLRADGVTPELLGIQRVVSEDAVRRALRAIEETPGVNGLQSHIDASVLPQFDAPWILDVDAAIKQLYGKQQEGAVMGYNPKKPGPLRAPIQMAGLRLILGVEVTAGNESNASHSLPGLLRYIDNVPKDKRPKRVRGDCGFGNLRSTPRCAHGFVATRPTSRKISVIGIIGIARYSSLVAPCPAPNGSHCGGRSTAVSRLKAPTRPVRNFVCMFVPKALPCRPCCRRSTTGLRNSRFCSDHARCYCCRLYHSTRT